MRYLLPLVMLAGCELFIPEIPVCGDTLVAANEACDDGNNVDTDSCTTKCELPRCGDGFVQSGEVCDDAGAVNGCRDDCSGVEDCGNGVLDPGEVCDDGNRLPGDGCRTNCDGEEVCGDGKLDKLIEAPRSIRLEYLATNCGLGPPPDLKFSFNGFNFATPTQDSPFCGCLFSLDLDSNPIAISSFTLSSPAALAQLQPTGNTITVSTSQLTNMFLAWAKVTIISDTHQQEIVIFDSAPTGSAESGVDQLCLAGSTFDEITQQVTFDVNLGEECDDGNTANGDGCRSNCVAARCGDGVVNAGELCDDGNTKPFDACPFNCSPLILELSQVAAARSDGKDLELLVEQGFASETGAAGVEINFRDSTGALISSPVAPLLLKFEDLLHTLQEEDLSGVRARTRTENPDLFLQNPELAAATELELTLIDRTGRRSSALVVPLVDETCGDGVVEATEECDDGGTLPGDGCSVHCLLPNFTLNFFVAGRAGDSQDPTLDDFVFFLDINAVEGGVSELRTNFKNEAGTSLLSPTIDLLALDPEIATKEGAFTITLKQPSFITGLLANASTVAVRIANQQGLTSNELSNVLADTICGDGRLVFPLEFCDDGNNVSGDGCSAVCGIDCSVNPARTNLFGALLPIGVFLLFVRRRRTSTR